MGETVYLYEDNAGHLFLALAGQATALSEQEVTTGLFRADAAALAAGDADEPAGDQVDLSTLQATHVASYIPDADGVQIHRGLGSAARDYIYGALG